MVSVVSVVAWLVVGERLRVRAREVERMVARSMAAAREERMIVRRVGLEVVFVGSRGDIEVGRDGGRGEDSVEIFGVGTVIGEVFEG